LASAPVSPFPTLGNDGAHFFPRIGIWLERARFFVAHTAQTRTEEKLFSGGKVPNFPLLPSVLSSAHSLPTQQGNFYRRNRMNLNRFTEKSQAVLSGQS
jgi:hypothetical protein